MLYGLFLLFKMQRIEKYKKATISHGEIREWIERHQGKPEIFDDPGALGDQPGIRISFPGDRPHQLMQAAVESKEVSWEEFFTLFEKLRLMFIYHDPHDGEKPIDAYKFIKRGNFDPKEFYKEVDFGE
jgi:hypothetical protein